MIDEATTEKNGYLKVGTHPTVLKYFSFFENDGVHYLLTQNWRGGDLGGDLENSRKIQ